MNIKLSKKTTVSLWGILIALIISTCLYAIKIKLDAEYALKSYDDEYNDVVYKAFIMESYSPVIYIALMLAISIGVLVATSLKIKPIWKFIGLSSLITIVSALIMFFLISEFFFGHLG